MSTSLTPKQAETVRDALRCAREKLQLYRANHSGEYLGGVEYTALMRMIDEAALAMRRAQPRAPSRADCVDLCSEDCGCSCHFDGDGKRIQGSGSRGT